LSFFCAEFFRRGSNPGFGSNIVICLWNVDEEGGVGKEMAFPVKVEVREKLVDATVYPWHCWMEMEANASEAQAAVLNIMFELIGIDLN
jgi:hypothetical protein